MSTYRILRFLRRLSGGYIIAFFLAIVALITGLVSSIEPTISIKVGILSYSEEAAAGDTLQKLLNFWFDKDNSMEVLYRTTKGDTSVQTRQLENLINDGCLVIILTGSDFSRDEAAVIAAGAAGAKILAINADVTGGARTYLGTNPYDEGFLLGDHLHHNLPQQANILYISGQDSFFTQQQLLGFSESCLLFRPDVKLLATINGKGTVAGAEASLKDFIKKSPHPKVDAIVATQLDLALTARETLSKAGLPAPLTYCISSEPDAAKAITQGTIQAAVGIDMSILAEEAHRMTAELAAGKAVPDKLYSPMVRTKANTR